MITVKCIKCKLKYFKYQKDWQGNLWHCWKSRIKVTIAFVMANEVRCTCGNLIGIEEENGLR